MKPNNRMIADLAFAVVCLTAIVVTPVAHAEMNANGAVVLTNGGQTDPGDASGARSELQNGRDGERYEWLLHPSSNVRAVRERTECGPTRDAPTQPECDASLGQ
jgi:hypothetical protein